MAERPPLTEDGRCEQCGVEIERRKNLQKKVDDMVTRVDSLHTFRSRLLGVSPLILLIILGSYSFTAIHQAESNAVHAKLENGVSANKEGLAEQRGTQRVIDERYLNVLRNLEGVRTEMVSLTKLWGEYLMTEARNAKKNQKEPEEIYRDIPRSMRP